MTEPRTTKRWSPSHVRLAAAVVDVREQLLNVAHRIPEHERRIIYGVCDRLRFALKARAVRKREAA